MKPAKLIIVFSDVWTSDQLALTKLCLQRGLDQIDKNVSSLNIFAGAEDCAINNSAAAAIDTVSLENCDIGIVVNATKPKVVAAIGDALQHDHAVILYVGETTTPFGHWVLGDGVFHSNSLLPLLQQSNGGRKAGNTCLLVTMTPCDDWQLLDKRQIDSFALLGYDLHPRDDDDLSPALVPLVDGLHHLLTVGGLSHQLSVSACSATVATSRHPSIYAFLDRGSPSVPALLALDGFAMLLNIGFNRSPDSLRYLQFYQQIDVALLTHIAYNNLLSLSAFNTMRLNHLLLPPIGVDSGSDSKLPTADDHNALHIDLKSYLTTALCELRNGGTQCSTVSIKAKSGGNSVKPVPLQLFHKIGYGSLELIPLCPLEDDADVKRSVDDWKKCKYANESQQKSVPIAVSALIVWKPFSPKAPIKRVLYIGSRCATRKYFPAVLTALHSSHDFLRQAEFVPADGLAKKTAAAPRKATTPPVATTTANAAPAASVAKTATHAPGAGKGKPGEKPSTARPSTAPHNTKDESSKRPHTATGKQPAASANAPAHAATARPATEAAKKGAATATKSATGPGANAPGKKPAAGTGGPSKRPESGKTAAAAAGGAKLKDAKGKTTSASAAAPAAKTAAVSVVPNNDGDVHVADHSGGLPHNHDVVHGSDKVTGHEGGHEGDNAAAHDGGIVPNGDHHDEHHEQQQIEHEPEEHKPEEHEPEEDELQHQEAHEAVKSVSDSAAKIVATVGTVECAITEHGEADFCDDTPEELSAAQMREMGLYDDDDNDDRGRNVPATGDSSRDIGNIAHLPMEGSFYGKDAVDVMDNGGGTEHHDWNQPLAMPAPVKDPNPKKGPKSASQIYVDCLCVPCDLDKDDLRCVFESVRFRTVFMQLERPEDLMKSLDVLLEEREKDGVVAEATTVVPSTVDESLLVWARDNGARLQACLVTVATDLTRCSITAGGAGAGDGGETCQGMKLEL